jgi:hypothetical protein
MKNKLNILLRKGLSVLALAVFMTGLSFNVRAEVDPTTAWWNNANFEAYELGTVLKASTEDPPGTAWSGNHDVRIQEVTSATNSTATGKVLGFTRASGNSFGENGSAAWTINKTFTNALSGYLYVKTAFFHSTGGTLYQFKNSSGEIVFEFGSNSTATSNALWFTGKTRDEVALGARSKWSDIEFVLDVNPETPKLLKIILTYAGTSKTFTDIALTYGGAINNLTISNANYPAAGFDNTTIGQLIGDQIKNLTGDAALNTIPDQSVSKNYSLTAFTDVMDLTLDIPNPALDIVWSISDWGTLSVGEQALVSIPRNSDDYTQAKLTVSDAISADAVITLKAALGNTELTFDVTLKAPSTEALKADLLIEITAAEALIDAIADSNPFLTGISGTLNTAIESAQGIYDNQSATLAGVNQAIDDIKAAQTAFSTALAPYTAFVAYIVAVQTIHDAETREAAFFTTIKGALSDAIATATNARSSVSAESDITAAQSALTAAREKFEADVPVYAGLQAAITANATILANADARKGDKFLNYATSTIEAMSDAISDANLVLEEGTTAEAFNAAISDLNEAIILLKATRNAPHSERAYRIFTYGVDGGNGNEVKKPLYDGDGALKYTEATPVENAEWNIVEVSTGIYTIQNKATGKYIIGAELSDTPANLTLPENTGQNKENEIDEGYFQYAIVNTANRALEVNDNNGFTVYSSGLPERLRFCFQFEELVNAQIPVITEQPQDAAVNANESVTLTVEASVEDGGTLSYQWYQNDENSNEGGSPVGTDDSSYSPSTENVGTSYYYVVVTNTNEDVNGETTASVTSNPATVTVDAQTGIEFIDANAGKAVKSVSYSDLLGRPVPENTQGIVIRRTTYEDNSVKTDKVFNAYRK